MSNNGPNTNQVKKLAVMFNKGGVSNTEQNSGSLIEGMDADQFNRHQSLQWIQPKLIRAKEIVAALTSENSKKLSLEERKKLEAELDEMKKISRSLPGEGTSMTNNGSLSNTEQRSASPIEEMDASRDNRLASLNIQWQELALKRAQKISAVLNSKDSEKLSPEEITRLKAEREEIFKNSRNLRGSRTSPSQ